MSTGTCWFCEAPYEPDANVCEECGARKGEGGEEEE